MSKLNRAGYNAKVSDKYVILLELGEVVVLEGT